MNRAGNSASRTIVVMIDTAPPRIHIFEPYNGSVMNRNTVSVQWRGDDDISGIDHFELYVDDNAINKSIPSTQTSYGVILSEGAHRITIRAIDKAGNIASASVIIKIDTTQPTVSITNLQNESIVNTSTVSIQWSGYDEVSGIDHFELYVNGGVINDSIPVTQISYTLTLSDGMHRITIIAVDKAGNIASDTVVIFVNTTSTAEGRTSAEGKGYEGAFGLFLSVGLIALLVSIVDLALIIQSRKRKHY